MLLPVTINGLDLADLAINAPHSDKVLDLLIEWFEKLDLPADRKIIPLAHHWIFEASFLRRWMGTKLLDDIFDGLARDSMVTALAHNDMANLRGEAAIYRKVNLAWLCNYFAIINENPHDALSDALAAAKVYKALLTRAISNVL